MLQAATKQQHQQVTSTDHHMLIILIVKSRYLFSQGSNYVLRVQTNGAVRPIIRKKAALCLLRLLRKAGPDADMLAPDAWSVKLVSLCHRTHA